MPGHKSQFAESYVTVEAMYREGIVAADVEPPVGAVDPIVFPQDSDGGVNPCRIGATNILFVYMLLDGLGMTITPRLWRILNDVAYEATPAEWVAVNQSAFLRANLLPAGDYVVTVTGAFNAGDVHLIEQHTE